MRPECRGFDTVVQGWQNQPSHVEFGSLLTDKEAITKRMERVLLMGVKEALYTNKSNWNSKQYAIIWFKGNEEKVESH